MRIALYARVSKADDQTTANQVLQLEAWAAAARLGGKPVEIAGVWEESVSSRDTRPKKEDLLTMLRLGKLEGVAFVSLSRWGRSLSEVVRELQEATDHGWVFISLKEGFRLDTASGRLLAGILAVLNDFEREIIRERTLAGLARVKAQGKRLGPPRGNQNARKRTPPVNPGHSSPRRGIQEQTSV